MPVSYGRCQLSVLGRFGLELRQKFCYREGGDGGGEMIRCARSDCYRGRNGQSHEQEDTEGSNRETETTVSDGRNGV